MDVHLIMIITIFEWKSGIRLTFDPDVGFWKLKKGKSSEFGWESIFEGKKSQKFKKSKKIPKFSKILVASSDISIIGCRYLILGFRYLLPCTCSAFLLRVYTLRQTRPHLQLSHFPALLKSNVQHIWALALCTDYWWRPRYASSTRSCRCLQIADCCPFFL